MANNKPGKPTAASMVGGIQIDGVDTPSTASAASIVRLERAVRMIPLDAIIAISPTQSRVVTFDPENDSQDADLLESVKKHGVLEPVWVKPVKTAVFGAPSQYTQVAGHRRVAAARLAGLQYVPAIVAKEDDDTASLTIAENVGIKPLSSFERATAINLLGRENPEMSEPLDIANATGIPLSSVYMLMSAISSPPALLAIFKSGVAARTIQAMQPLFAAVPVGDQERLAALISDARHSQVEKIADLVKAGENVFVAADLVLSGKTLGSAAKDKSSAGDSAPAEDREAVSRTMAELTGADLPSIRQLIEEYGSTLSSDALTAACLYMSRGGDYSHATEMASQLQSTPAAFSLAKKYIGIVFRAKSLVSQLQEENPAVAEFLRMISVGQS
jgi:ParB-like partition proteins